MAIRGRRSRVPDFARQQAEIDADLADAAFPLVGQLVVEDQLVVGRHAQPGVGLDLRVELARAPAGIAEGEQAALRALAGGDVAQDVERRGEADGIADIERGVVAIVRRYAARSRGRSRPGRRCGCGYARWPGWSGCRAATAGRGN